MYKIISLTTNHHHMQWLKPCLVLMAVFLLYFQAEAQEIIQPKRYFSISGNYALMVSPHNPDGISGAQYSLHQGEKPLWSQVMNFTAVKADVSNTGHVITCSHSSGKAGGEWLAKKRDLGYMKVHVYDASGKLMWSQATKRNMSMRFHASPEPSCDQVMINNHTNQAYIWSHVNQTRQHFLALGLNNYQATETVDFPTDMYADITGIDSIKYHDIPNSPLVMVEVYGHVYEETETTTYGYSSDVLFYLVDDRGQVYWHQHLLGSIDDRSFGEFDYQLDAYLEHNDLFEFDSTNNQFTTTDYMAGINHRFQLVNQQVKTLDQSTFTPPQFNYNSAPETAAPLKLLNQINLSSRSDSASDNSFEDSPCTARFADADVLNDGSLVVFDEDLFQVGIYNANELAQSTMTPNTFKVPEDLKLDDDISGDGLFTDGEDRIWVNLDQTNYAVYNRSGQLQEVIDFDPDCKKYCTQTWISNKNALFWLKSYNAGLNRVRTSPNHQLGNHSTRFITEKIIRKDHNGRWLEYINELTTHNGRLLVASRINTHQHLLHLFDESGQPLFSIETGNNYLTAISLSENSIFISKHLRNEIIQLNLQGEILNRFNTPNNQVAYRLQASDEHLFVFTNDQIFIYSLN